MDDQMGNMPGGVMEFGEDTSDLDTVLPGENGSSVR